MTKTYEATKKPTRLPSDVISTGKEITTADSSYYEAYQQRPYNPAILYQRKDYDVYDTMREDDQVGPMLSLKKQIILNSDGVIEAEDPKVKEFLEWNLNEVLEGGFTRNIYTILTALDYGFSITEKIYSLMDSQDHGQKIVLKKLKTRAPHTFEIHTDKYGNIEFVRQHTGGADVDINPNKLIIYSYQKEFDNAYGKADINTGVYRAWWAKEAIIKFWNIYLERFASPLTVGTIQRKAGEGDKNAFKAVLKDISAKTAITVPEGFEIKFLKGDGSAGEFEAAIDKYNMMISRALLIPDLLGFSGSKTGGGSLALGKEQFDIFYTIIEYIRNDVQRLINQEIIQPLVKMNFAPGTKAEFKFEKVDYERKEKEFSMWLDAVDTGKIPVLPKHINWALENVNAPIIKEDEFKSIEKEKAALQEQMNQGNDKPIDNPIGKKDDKKKDGKPKEDDIDDEEKEDEKDNTAKDYVISREMTENEKKADVEKIDETLTGKEDQGAQDLSKIFMLSINGVLDDIKRNKIIEKKKINKVNDLSIRNMRQVNKEVSGIMKDSFDYGFSTVSVKTFDISGVKEVADWFKEYAFYVSDTEGAFILKTIKPTVLDAIRTGKSYNEAAKMARAALDSYDMDVDGHRVKTTVNTTIAKSFNEARKQGFEEIGDEIIGYEYSAIRDKRTSTICKALDNLIFRPEELEKYNPPNHFNCRSLVIPIFRDEVNEDFKFNEMPGTENVAGDFLELK